jgi:hypothetical protein
MDWNLDGLPDLVLGDTGSLGSFTVYLNEGTRAEPKFSRGVWFPYNCTETAPATIEHSLSQAFCDLNHDGKMDLLLYEGRLRYLPNLGTQQAPFLWTQWPNKPWGFPGTPAMCHENTRFPAGPESMFWNKGVFPRQVLTMTACDWNADGLQDLIVCRFKHEAPGVTPVHPNRPLENWTPWITPNAPKPDAKAPAATPEFLAPLRTAPERELVFYNNGGTREQPSFDQGSIMLDESGASIAAPNPFAADIDGDGLLDVVACETRIHRNSFRVDWPTRPHLTWFRRLDAESAQLAAGQDVLDAACKPILAGVAATFHDMRGCGVKDLLIVDADTGSVRWYQNQAKSEKQPMQFSPAITLVGKGILRFERSYQSCIVDWFGKGSQDLILFGENDAHCKYSLRRAALYRNTSKPGSPHSYRMEGYFSYKGDSAMVPVSEEEHQYDRYRCSLCVVPGQKQILATVGSRLFLFDQLSADGLTFQRMRPVPLPGSTNRIRGWQDIAISGPKSVQYVKLINDPNGMGNFNDGYLNVDRLELHVGGKNIATPENIESVVSTKDEPGKKPNILQPMNMLHEGNASTSTTMNATSFGFHRGGAVIKLKSPASIERIRFLLTNRQTEWYRQLVSFYWQGKLMRLGFEEDEIYYHYKAEVSADGQTWTTVSDRSCNERVSVFPQALDWDADGRWDLLVGMTQTKYNYPAAKTYTLLRNTGSNEDPIFNEVIPLCDETGKPISVQAQWTDQYAMHCCVKPIDLDSDGQRDLIIEGFTPKNELLYLKNVSTSLLQPRFTKPVKLATAAGRFEFPGRYRYFDIADMNADGIPDLINSNEGLPTVFAGLATAAPGRVSDLELLSIEAKAIRLRWTKPQNKPQHWEIRWSTDPIITEQNWAQLPVQQGDYDAAQKTVEALVTLPTDAALHFALRSFNAVGQGSAVSETVSMAAPSQITLRNGPADGSCLPEYAGFTVATLDAAKPGEAIASQQTFEVRTCEASWGGKPKTNEKMALIRIAALPDKPVKRAILRLCVNTEPLAMAPDMVDRISCNLLPPKQWSSAVSWQARQPGQAWECPHAERGTLVSFAKHRFTVEAAPWLEWDITSAINHDTSTGGAVDLLLRSEFMGHYTSLVGFKFFGPEWKELRRRPQVRLEY